MQASLGHVLLVDDDEDVRWSIARFLGDRGFAVTECATFADACQALKTLTPSAILLDRMLAEGDTVPLLAELQSLTPRTPVIMMTAHGSIDVAVRAMRGGAVHFLIKPIEFDQMESVVREAIASAPTAPVSRSSVLRKKPSGPNPFLGSSPAIRTLREEVERVLDNNRPVLLLGETGSGKSVLARYIHEHGVRASSAFVDLNCAGLTKELLGSELFGHDRGAFTGAQSAKVGLVEAADNGTLFLDEIGDMDVAIQPKLLKVLEEKRIRRLGEVRDRNVDVRLISATHQDLDSAVRARSFRADLYFRISAFPITVPPLRSRVQDISALADEVAAGLAGELGRPRARISPSALSILERHDWPGNVRELRNVLDRALMRASDVIEPAHLVFDRTGPQPVRVLIPTGAPEEEPTATRLTLREHEAQLIETALREEGGRVDAAARRLGMPRSSLYQKLRELGLGRRR